MNPQSHQQTTVIQLGSLATDNTQIPAVHFAFKTRITKAVLINGAAIAASDTDYVQLGLQVVGGAVLAEIDSRAAHENGLVKNVGKALNIADSEGALVLAGQNLEIDYQEAGTVALTNAVLVITHYAV